MGRTARIQFFELTPLVQMRLLKKFNLGQKHFYEENERIEEEEKAHRQRNLNPQPPDLLAGALTAELQLTTSAHWS